MYSEMWKPNVAVSSTEKQTKQNQRKTEFLQASRPWLRTTESMSLQMSATSLARVSVGFFLIKKEDLTSQETSHLQ